MSAQHARIFLTKGSTVFLQEQGTGGRVFKASITQIEGIDSGETDFPDRLLRRVVRFTHDGLGNAVTVFLLEPHDGYRDTDCGEHEISARTSGARDCECGNPMGPSMNRCVVCSLRDDKCVYCDNAID